MNEIRQGDTVRLKTGGPEMLVWEVKGQVASCVRERGGIVPHPVENLVKVNRKRRQPRIRHTQLITPGAMG